MRKVSKRMVCTGLVLAVCAPAIADADRAGVQIMLLSFNGRGDWKLFWQEVAKR